jgi:TPR repeat protein
MKLFNITTLIVPFLLLSGCDAKNKESTLDERHKIMLNAIFPPSNTVEERIELEKQAESGDAVAQTELGLMYDEGEKVPEDNEKAFFWYQKAAAKGFVMAEFYLGAMYVNGDGVPKDISKAVEWFEKAASEGVAEAQFRLGVIYYSDEYERKDFTKAFEWFEKAANNGHGESQFKLGLMYELGDGAPKDINKALEWYQKSATHEVSAGAAQNLGNIYYFGKGVPKNPTKAAEWYSQAAALGSMLSQHNLGLMYYLGDGVVKNKAKAYAWLNLAAAQGDENAKLARDDIETKLSKDELVEAQRLSSNWKIGDNLLVVSNVASSNVNSVPNRQPTKQKYGTAVIVSKDGHALTNHHVINGCGEIKIAGREGGAKLITSDSANDIALLQLPNNNDNFAKINPEPNKLRQGEDVIVFGYPLNSVLSSGGNLTFGTVSALSGLNNNTNQIQITAPIQPGSSGSPVMDKKGDIVGIVSMKLDDTKMAKATGSIGQTVNFAVNGQTVKTFLDTNNVPYKTGGGFFSMEKNNADIAEEAKKWTVLVECWK